jgi:hypothetical protein
MGLIFYPKSMPLPEDHCLHKLLKDLPDRFSKQKLVKDWIIEGPFKDEEAEEYYFFLIGRTSGTREQFSLKETAFLFNENAVSGMISKMIARCSEVELGLGVAGRLMGKSSKEVLASESEDIYIVEDFSKGKGRVEHRRKSLTDGDARPDGKTGGLIIASR